MRTAQSIVSWVLLGLAVIACDVAIAIEHNALYWHPQGLTPRTMGWSAVYATTLVAVHYLASRTCTRPAIATMWTVVAALAALGLSGLPPEEVKEPPKPRTPSPLPYRGALAMGLVAPLLLVAWRRSKFKKVRSVTSHRLYEDDAIGDAIRRAWATYETSADHDDPNLRLALEHEALPLIVSWTGFLGLRRDGTLISIDEERGEIPDEPLTPYVQHLARIEAARRYPELAHTMPEPADDWIACDVCGGSGAVIIEGQMLESLVCKCGGLGSIPPHVHAFMTAHASWI